MANEITITIPSEAALAAIFDLPVSEVTVDAVVVQGPPGPPGPPGANGDGSPADPGDLTLLFNNKLL